MQGKAINLSICGGVAISHHSENNVEVQLPGGGMGGVESAWYTSVTQHLT